MSKAVLIKTQTRETLQLSSFINSLGLQYDTRIYKFNNLHFVSVEVINSLLKVDLDSLVKRAEKGVQFIKIRNELYISKYGLTLLIASSKEPLAYKIQDYIYDVLYQLEREGTASIADIESRNALLNEIAKLKEERVAMQTVIESEVAARVESEVAARVESEVAVRVEAAVAVRVEAAVADKIQGEVEKAVEQYANEKDEIADYKTDLEKSLTSMKYELFECEEELATTKKTLADTEEELATTKKKSEELESICTALYKYIKTHYSYDKTKTKEFKETIKKARDIAVEQGEDAEDAEDAEDETAINTAARKSMARLTAMKKPRINTALSPSDYTYNADDAQKKLQYLMRSAVPLPNRPSMYRWTVEDKLPQDNRPFSLDGVLYDSFKNYSADYMLDEKKQCPFEYVWYSDLEISDSQTKFLNAAFEVFNAAPSYIVDRLVLATM